MKTVICSQCKSEISADDIICMNCGCPNYNSESTETSTLPEKKVRKPRVKKEKVSTEEEVVNTDIAEEEQIIKPLKLILDDEEEQELINKDNEENDAIEEKEDTSSEDEPELKEENSLDGLLDETTNEEIEPKEDMKESKESTKENKNEEDDDSTEETHDEEEENIELDKEESQDKKDEEETIEEEPELKEENSIDDLLDEKEEELPIEDETTNEEDNSLEENQIEEEEPELKEENSIDDLLDKKEEGSNLEDINKGISLKKETPIEDLVGSNSIIVENIRENDTNEEKTTEQEEFFKTPAEIIEETSDLILTLNDKEEIIDELKNKHHLDDENAKNYIELAIRMAKTKLDKMKLEHPENMEIEEREKLIEKLMIDKDDKKINYKLYIVIGLGVIFLVLLIILIAFVM